MQKRGITLVLLAITAIQVMGTCHANDISSENGPEILIGYFGPSDVNHPEGGDLWCAATLAIEQANAAGGFQGHPFKLIAGWSENPWGSGVKDLTRMAYENRVCAILGGIDGPSTHLAEQVVAKARLPLLSGANADRTANLANVAWMFSSLPGHPLQAAALTDAIASRIQHGRFVMVSCVDHDSHILTDELKKCFRQRDLVPGFHYEFKSEPTLHLDLVDRIIQAHVEAVVIIAPLVDTANLTVSLRTQGFTGTLFGGPCMSRQRYLDQAGDAAEGVIFPLLYEPTEKSTAFEQALWDRFNRHGDYLSAYTFDTVNLLINAIKNKGLDRQGIRDEIVTLSPWQGVTGLITWDQRGANTRPVATGTIKNGCIKPLTLRASTPLQ